ncbi:MAG TPA: hypothetical protein VM911_13920 [Pyrinomonadaceae bacterium]|jgi:hypothetical protein|nr:hypothetical protein [Pyrinomonadaceae bacterium]
MEESALKPLHIRESMKDKTTGGLHAARVPFLDVALYGKTFHTQKSGAP